MHDVIVIDDAIKFVGEFGLKLQKLAGGCLMVFLLQGVDSV